MYLSHHIILNGHVFHVTLSTIIDVEEMVVDILTFLSHINHAMRPLDVNVFKLFKTTFEYFKT